MSHQSGTRYQKRKHHIHRQLRQWQRAATVATAVAAVAGQPAHARDEGSSAKARQQRITNPSAPPANSVSQPARTLPQTSLIAVSGISSTVARSHASIESRSLGAGVSPALPTSPTVLTSPQPTEVPSTAAGGAIPTATQTSTTDNRVLLAQLDAELRKTQATLETTDAKLSAGQRELLGLSNTLRSVMLRDGDYAAGLHPFVKVASRYAGTPYVWGGESRYGFDCSGFIIRVMRDLGYRALPHSAAEQFTYGQPVAQALLKPGDLVFFANTYKPGISHVGIYIGKRRFIHAASTKQGTIISSLDAQPYNRKYAGARRLTAAQKT